MPRVRFRIRTIMLAVLVVAVFMAISTALMRLPPWMRLIRLVLSGFYALFVYMLAHPIMAFLAIALFVSVVQFVVFWDRFRSLRRQPRPHSRKGAEFASTRGIEERAS
jgi:hypothetical protein